MMKATPWAASGVKWTISCTMSPTTTDWSPPIRLRSVHYSYWFPLLFQKIIDFPGGQRSNKHTVKNSLPRPWLCLFNTHFFAIIFDCKKLTWLIWDSDQTWPISMGWSEKVSCPSMPCPINDTLLSLELQLREEEGEEGAMRMTDTPPIMKMKLMSMTKKTPIILGHWCCQSAWFANLLSPPSPIWILTHTRPSILKKPMFAFCTNHIQF